MTYPRTAATADASADGKYATHYVKRMPIAWSDRPVLLENAGYAAPMPGSASTTTVLMVRTAAKTVFVAVVSSRSPSQPYLQAEWVTYQHQQTLQPQYGGCLDRKLYKDQ